MNLILLVNGVWKDAENSTTIIDPLNGDAWVTVPDTKVDQHINP